MPVVGGHAGVTILPLWSQASGQTLPLCTRAVTCFSGHHQLADDILHVCSLLCSSASPAIMAGVLAHEAPDTCSAYVTQASPSSDAAGLPHSEIDALTKRTQDGGTEVVQAKAGKVLACYLLHVGLAQWLVYSVPITRLLSTWNSVLMHFSLPWCRVPRRCPWHMPARSSRMPACGALTASRTSWSAASWSPPLRSSHSLRRRSSLVPRVRPAHEHGAVLSSWAAAQSWAMPSAKCFAILSTAVGTFQISKSSACLTASETFILRILNAPAQVPSTSTTSVK